MTHFLNEYWDVEADRLNESRTMFSGGSGILANGLLRPGTALTAAIVCLASSAAFAVVLAVMGSMTPLTLGLMLSMFLGAYFYSSPPLRLASSGFGELTASLVVAGLVPTLGLVLSEGRPSLIFVAVVAPLVLLHYAMLLAFEFPDEPSDRKACKRTLLVRTGTRRGALVHNGCLLVGVLLALIGPITVLPARTALVAVIVAPLAVRQMFTVSAVVQGRRLQFRELTFIAVVNFALTTVLLAAVVWSV